jgi:hypothetical protein
MVMAHFIWTVNSGIECRNHEECKGAEYSYSSSSRRVACECERTGTRKTMHDFFGSIESRHEGSHCDFTCKSKPIKNSIVPQSRTFWSHYCSPCFSYGHSVSSRAVNVSKIRLYRCRRCSHDYPDGVALTVLIRSHHLHYEHSDASQCHCPCCLFGCNDSSVPIQ